MDEEEVRKIYPEYKPNKQQNRFIDRTNERFGRLTVLYRTYNQPGRNANWVCKCDCGNYTVVTSGNLTQGHIKSCGCFEQESRILSHRKQNLFDLSNEYGIGYTSNTHQPFLFDKDDYDLIKDFCWMENDQGYILSYTNNRKSPERMHRFLLKPNKDEIIDHINGNRADNRRNNLRISNKQLNGINRGCNKTNLIGYKGVSYDKRNKRYASRIYIEGKNIFLGYYDTPEEASQVRIDEENRLFGDYSYYKSKESIDA